MKFTKSLSLGWKFVVDRGGWAGVDVANHSNFPSLVISASEPSDVVIQGEGRSMSEEAMIRLEGGGDDDNNFGFAIHPRGFIGASGSLMLLLGFSSKFIEPSSSSSCSRLITTLLATDDDDKYFRMGGDLQPFRRGLIVLNRLGSFLGVMPSVPLGVNSRDSEAVRRPLRFVGVLLGELFLLRLDGVLSIRSLE